MIKVGQRRRRGQASVKPAAGNARLPRSGPRLGRRTAAQSVRYAVVTLGLAGMLLGAAAVASGPAAYATGHSTGWSIVPSPNGVRSGDNALVQVSAGSAATAWAVGHDGYNGNFRTLIEHWNGARWAAVPSPSIGPLDNVLSGVARASATSAWAVGYTSASVPPRIYHRAMIEHWNGHRWRVVPTPQAGTSDSDLWGVTALSASNAWAVGNQNVGFFTFRPLVEHWNGTTWTLVRVPSPPLTATGASLFGVAAISPRDIWAVGDYATQTGSQPLIEHFNGTRWALVPAPAAGSAILNRISMSTPSDGWAVGLTGASAPARSQPLIEHWNGHRWTPARTPASPGSSLADVLALNPHLAWAVGSAAAPHGLTRTLTERWNGHTWAITPSPNHPPASELTGIAGTQRHLWAVGAALTNTLILRH